MKKLFAVVLAFALALSMAACDLFADETTVQFEDLYTHADPDGLNYDEQIVLIGKDFGASLEELVNSYAWPDTMIYDENGEMIGMYDYDPETGMAYGWMDLMTGEYYEEEVELGLPDESLMISLSGDVTLGAVIYGKEGKAVYCCIYAFLGSAEDQPIVQETLESCYGYCLTAESDTVLVLDQDEAAIDAQFQQWQEWYGAVLSDRSATVYADNLRQDLGLSYYGVNPYAPYDGITDPDGLDYEEKVLLTSSGSYSFVDSSLENDMTGRTDVIYGKDGVVIAHVIYYVYESKAAADKLEAAADGNFFGQVVRVSDTVVADVMGSDIIEAIVSAYIGYGVLSDDSIDGYIACMEETYFLMRYEA